MTKGDGMMLGVGSLAATACLEFVKALPTEIAFSKIGNIVPDLPWSWPSSDKTVPLPVIHLPLDQTVDLPQTGTTAIAFVFFALAVLYAVYAFVMCTMSEPFQLFTVTKPEEKSKPGANIGTKKPGVENGTKKPSPVVEAELLDLPMYSLLGGPLVQEKEPEEVVITGGAAPNEIDPSTEEE